MYEIEDVSRYGKEGARKSKVKRPQALRYARFEPSSPNEVVEEIQERAFHNH